MLGIKLTKQYQHHAIWILLFLLFARLISMCFIPLNDSTEARYGEIARIMLETGNWVTPMQEYGIPFWAKPPLSTWLSAFSMKLLGVSEFAVRLPALLLSIGILGLIWSLARRQRDASFATLSTVILAGTSCFFLDAGTVMTDPALLFCTTLCLASFWRAIICHEKHWGYWFFVGLGLGLLAKGPIAIVLTGMPLFFWVLVRRQWLELWRRLPWVLGTALMLAIALPWYLLAESRTPGFINYFIIGEHIRRFLQPGWQGDQYGFAHLTPVGMIWLYALMAFIPWSIVAFVWFIRHGKQLMAAPRPTIKADQSGWILYLVLWALMPLLFFTAARNIIYPYVFPTLPPLALLFTELANRIPKKDQVYRHLTMLSALTGIIFLSGALLFAYMPEKISNSQKRVVNAYKAHRTNETVPLVYWANKVDYSARFYSGGKAVAINESQQLCQYLSIHRVIYLAVKSTDITKITQCSTVATQVATIPYRHFDYFLINMASIVKNIKGP